MSNLKELIKSKIKPKENNQIPATFDQNQIDIKVQNGKTQLTQVRLMCSWTKLSSTVKLPELNCKWFNKTEDNIQQIPGIDGDYYQPSICDVGSILHVQCNPKHSEIEYEGMPIIREIGPICLSQETEEEANNMLKLGKASFFVDVKQLKMEGKQKAECFKEGLIRICNNSLALCRVQFGEMHDLHVLEIPINENYPQLTLNRRFMKEMKIVFSEGQYANVNFSNNKLRDIMALLNQLIVIHQQSNNANLQSTNQAKQPEHIQIQLQSQLIPKQSNSNMHPKQQENQDILQKKVSSEDSLTLHSDNTTLPLQNNSPNQFKSKSEEGSLSTESLDPKEKQPSKTTSHPNKKIIEVQKQIEQIRIPDTVLVKSSTIDLLNIAELKKQVKKLQAQNLKGKKELEEEKLRYEEQREKIKEGEERMKNQSRNYLELESEYKEMKDKINSNNEQLLYHKKETQLLRAQKQRLASVIDSLQQKVLAQDVKLRLFEAQQTNPDQTTNATYEELKSMLEQKQQRNSEISLKYQYEKQEKEKYEEVLKNSRNAIEQIESQKKYIERKYESLAFEVSNGNSPALNKSRLSELSIESNSEQNSEDLNLQKGLQLESIEVGSRQKQILELKKQLKDLIDQNNYLRSLAVKDKKPSSRTQMKFELFEVKKLANKLAEAVTEKEMSLEHMKSVNKQLNHRIIELQKAKEERVDQ